MAASVVDSGLGLSSRPGSGPGPGLGSRSGSGPVPARYGRSRQALVDATIALAGRVGFHRVTVAELSVLAGLGPRTFYNHFADLSDVFFEACWQIHEDLRRAVRVAYDGAGPGGGRAGVDDGAARGRDGDGGAPDRDDSGACGSAVPGRDRAWACVEVIVGFVQADPLRARVLFVEGYAGGPAVAELRAETIEWLIGLVVGEGGSRGARLSAEFAVGGIHGALYSRIKAGDLAGLSDLIPSFVDTLARTAHPASH